MNKRTLYTDKLGYELYTDGNQFAGVVKANDSFNLKFAVTNENVIELRNRDGSLDENVVIVKNEIDNSVEWFY